MRSLLLVPLASTKMHEDPQEDFQDTCKRPAGKLHDFEIDFQEPPRIDLQEASKRMTLGPRSWHTCSGKDQIPDIRPHLDPVHLGLVRSLVLSGRGRGA